MVRPCTRSVYPQVRGCARCSSQRRNKSLSSPAPPLKIFATQSPPHCGGEGRGGRGEGHRTRRHRAWSRGHRCNVCACAQSLRRPRGSSFRMGKARGDQRGTVWYLPQHRGPLQSPRALFRHVRDHDLHRPSPQVHCAAAAGTTNQRCDLVGGSLFHLASIGRVAPDASSPRRFLHACRTLAASSLRRFCASKTGFSFETADCRLPLLQAVAG